MGEYVYKLVDEAHDFGGVHINSGIPKKAFYLVATALGGNSWENPGQIWWKAIRSGLQGQNRH
jgi:Zn-dependent metalloprotease